MLKKLLGSGLSDYSRINLVMLMAGVATVLSVAKLVFQTIFYGEGRCKTRNLPWGEYGYFLEMHNLFLLGLQ